MEHLIQFFGRLHPLLVHLPIGILLLAVVLHFLGRWPKFAALRELLPVLWFAGAVTAVLAQQQILALDLRVELATLDDAFVALTGRSNEPAPF